MQSRPRETKAPATGLPPTRGGVGSQLKHLWTTPAFAAPKCVALPSYLGVREFRIANCEQGIDWPLVWWVGVSHSPELNGESGQDQPTSHSGSCFWPASLLAVRRVIRGWFSISLLSSGSFKSHLCVNSHADAAGTTPARNRTQAPSEERTAQAGWALDLAADTVRTQNCVCVTCI